MLFEERSPMSQVHCSALAIDEVLWTDIFEDIGRGLEHLFVYNVIVELDRSVAATDFQNLKLGTEYH